MNNQTQSIETGVTPFQRDSRPLPPAAPVSEAVKPPSMPKTASIAALIVTRNRLALLKECIAAVRAQTRSLDEIIVVNNASDDGTNEWLEEQTDLTVVHQGNEGGAGGFHAGLKIAYGRGHDWFWCMDDDTIPHPDALERLCATPYFDREDTGYLGSVVQWTDGSLHKMNMFGNQVRTGDMTWYSRVLQDRCVPSGLSSFVSILVSRAAVRKCGLPIKEFFIWWDDSEYTRRITEHYQNYHVLDSIVVHKTPANSGSDLETAKPGEWGKFAYGLRNELYFIRHEKNAPWRTGLRVASFLARKTYVILKRRAPLFLLRRLWAGLFFTPRIEMVDKAEEVAA